MVESSRHQTEEIGNVVEILSEAYMGTSRLKREDLETKEEEVWPIKGKQKFWALQKCEVRRCREAWWI